MSRLFTLLGLVVVVAAGAALFQLKHAVEARQAEVDRLAGEIVAHRKAIRVLQAEWSYLSDPDRLQDLSSRHLNLRPMMAEQVLPSLDALPWRQPGDGPVTAPPSPIVPSPKEKPTRAGKAQTANAQTVKTWDGRDLDGWLKRTAEVTP